MGIDEAGRGPVCGPMTYGAAYGPIEGEKRLRGMGFADSKKLTEEKRDELFKDIKGAPDFLGWIVSILSAADISAAMMGRINYNLNALSHDTAIDMIKKVLAKGVNLKELYIDTVGIEHLYQQKLEKIFPQLNITVTKKADDKFPICSAASICAKVTRDQVIEQWRHLELVNLSKQIGSGYPGDPITKKWIGTATDPIFGFPSKCRSTRACVAVCALFRAFCVSFFLFHFQHFAFQFAYFGRERGARARARSPCLALPCHASRREHVLIAVFLL